LDDNLDELLPHLPAVALEGSGKPRPRSSEQPRPACLAHRLRRGEQGCVGWTMSSGNAWPISSSYPRAPCLPPDRRHCGGSAGAPGSL